MNTKIVYVIVSSLSDIYFEQAWASIWSLRFYNPQCMIDIVVDEQTIKVAKNSYRAKMLPLVDNIVMRKFSEEINNRERSRSLKTNLLHIVSGDYLFIDTDTIITGDLSFVDNIVSPMAMVDDMNCNFIENPNYVRLSDRLKSLFGVKVLPSSHYYNSGVIYAKDNQDVHDFYRGWFKNWSLSKDKGCFLDQPALYKTCMDYPNIVDVMSGEFNCQPSISIKFLSDAKIVHFFNDKNAESDLSPFFTGEIYKQIKKEEELSDEIKRCLLNCKSSFSSPSKIIPGEDVLIWSSNSFTFIKTMSRKYPKIFHVMEVLSFKLSSWMLKG